MLYASAWQTTLTFCTAAAAVAAAVPLFRWNAARQYDNFDISICATAAVLLCRWSTAWQYDK
jgi:hypothetical protein